MHIENRKLYKTLQGRRKHFETTPAILRALSVGMIVHLIERQFIFLYSFLYNQL